MRDDKPFLDVYRPRKAKDLAIYKCDCGNRMFYFFDNGIVECVSCGKFTHYLDVFRGCRESCHESNLIHVPAWCHDGYTKSDT